MLYPNTFQPYLGWIQRLGLISLLTIGLSIYLFAVGLFAILYASLDCALIHLQARCPDPVKIHFWEYAFFSLSIQSTLGSSGLTAYSGLGHALVSLQIIVGMIYGGVLVGAIFARFLMLNPSAILIDDTIGFDPRVGQLTVRVTNLFNIPVYEINVKLLAVRKRSSDNIMKRTALQLVAPTISVLESKIPTRMRTREARLATDVATIDIVQHELPTLFSPLELGSIALSEGEQYGELLELRLIISASAPFGLVQRTKVFGMDAIRCGQHVTMDKGRIFGEYSFSNFNKFLETKYDAMCGDCPWCNGCGLKRTINT